MLSNQLKISCFCLLAAVIPLTGCNKDYDINKGEELYPVPVEVAVTDYSPAPGQFVNTMPVITEDDSRDDILQKCTVSLNSGELVSLGALGGNITIRTVSAVTGKFEVIGNALSTSAEPGIVRVSEDGINYYVIPGECFDEARKVVITYYSPESDTHDERHIRYTLDNGETGYIPRLPAYHTQDYYPSWVNEGNLSFSCMMLPPNGYRDENGLFALKPYKGYSDCWIMGNVNAILDISDAVDSEGKPANLKNVYYINVTTGVLQNNGILGECSTEVRGVRLYLKTK